MTPTAKEEAEMLLNALLPFAQQQLEKYAEFFPFGASMLMNGEIRMTSIYNGQEHPASQDVIDEIKSVFLQEAKNGNYKATGLVYNISFIDPQTKEKRDGVSVALDHKDHYSIIVTFPYVLKENNQVQFFSPTASKGKGEIFLS